MNLPIHANRAYTHSATEIYDLIINLPEIIKEFPIIKKVETPTPDIILVTINIDVPFYSGSYIIEIGIVDKQPFELIKLKGYHKSRIGKLTLDVAANISPLSNLSNNLSVSGDFYLRGMITFAGKKTISNGITTGLQHMFDYLDKHLGVRSLDT